MPDRKTKLAEKLRANLKQRKSQQKIRQKENQKVSNQECETVHPASDGNHKNNIEPSNG